MCLRSCLVSLREMNAGCLGPDSHQTCDRATCKINCIRKLQFDLKHYVDEMAKAILKKENHRNLKWWLAAFYSFCIQSVVRKALILIADALEPKACSVQALNCQNYLYMAIRLYTAISGNWDPLSQQSLADSSTHFNQTEEFMVEHYQLARLAINQGGWIEESLKRSAEYLHQIFEDDEHALGSASADTRHISEPDITSFSIHPQPYLPSTFNIEIYRTFRADWDLARCNYTKHAVITGKQYGWESEIYNAIEQKWSSIGALWKKYNAITISNILKTFKHSSMERPPSKHTNHSRKLDAIILGRGTRTPLDTLLQPNIYASLRGTNCAPDVKSSEDIHEEETRFSGDLYWPRWLRGPYNGVQEGWCGMCQPGRWLSLDGQFQDDKDFNHGISGCTGKPYDKPKMVGLTKGLPNVWWGLCSICDEWIELVGSKEGENAWFVHAFGVSFILFLYY